MMLLPNMLLRPERFSISSDDTPSAVLQRLQATASEWRESRLTALARSAGILGWKLRVSAERITLRAQIGGRNGFLPHFTGAVEAQGAGSVITGEIRLNWFSRVFALVWLGGVGIGPLLALIEPVPGQTFGEHLVWAIIMIVPCGALFALGRWGISRSYEAPARALEEFLRSAARAASTDSGAPSIDSPVVHHGR
jgi:hypothetical protein